MTVKYNKATQKDAQTMIDILNLSFFSDFKKYGECPIYNMKTDDIIDYINNYDCYIITKDGTPVATAVVMNQGDGIYFIGTIGVIPKYQHIGIGQRTMNFLINTYRKAKQIDLITPADNTRNIDFYKQLGFVVVQSLMDGNVKVNSLTYINK